MKIRPKRRKLKDNPYILEENFGTYKIIFKDSIGKKQCINISIELYQVFDKFELEDLSQLNEYDNHIEHSELYEETLNKRILEKPKSIEQIVEENIIRANLKEAISRLPETQKRRIKKYYFDEMTLEEIAKEENCSKVAIKYSIDIGIEKLKMFFKNIC